MYKKENLWIKVEIVKNLKIKSTIISDDKVAYITIINLNYPYKFLKVLLF